jgi:hypothetical protein
MPLLIPRTVSGVRLSVHIRQRSIIYSVHYDQKLNFVQIAYVWSGPWRPGKVLFILNRYLVFVDTFLLLNGAQSLTRCIVRVITLPSSDDHTLVS